MTEVGREVPDRAADFGPPSVDRAVAALAGRQHGVIARGQLRELGLRDSAISDRAARGRLHRVHQGVYAVGHPRLGAHGRWLAAVLACGPGAVLSHAAAAALWGLRPSAATVIDVTGPPQWPAKARWSAHPPAAGAAQHRDHKARGHPGDHAGADDPRPAATLQRRPLERLLDQAENTRLTDVASLNALARAHTGHRGATRLLATLDTHVPGTTITKSALEERFLQLCDDHGLPRPLVNHWIANLEVDFVFREARVVVETDGYRFHRTRDSSNATVTATPSSREPATAPCA